MANPQKEDGYTAIANDIMDALIASELSGQDFKVSLLIIRKTYGFNKSEDAVSLTQMMAATGMSKIRCSQVVNRLELMKILTVTENINGIGKKYKFNKDFETWGTVKENINRLEKTILTVKKKRNRPLRKSVTTKDNIQKTITKDNIMPAGLSEKTFFEFLAIRKKKRAPLLEDSYPRFFKELQKICDQTRASPEEILNQSIVNGWQGIFPLKNGGNNGSGNTRHGFSGSTGTAHAKTGNAQSDGTPWPADREY